jgi:hypothetical protein
MTDAGWQAESIDLATWIPAYCRSRYGACPPATQEAWSLLLKSAYLYRDLDVQKNWQYHERYNLQFRFEAFNALNHPSFGQPDSNPDDSNFGAITSTGALPARVGQAALKLTF